MNNLKEIREKYFSATESERHSLVTEFCEIQQDMLLKTINKLGKESSKKYARLYSWKPFKNELTDWFDAEWMFGVKNGFDIIIGNPPYIQLQKEDSDGGKFGDTYKDCGFETFAKAGDIYCLFFEKGYNLLKNTGILSFITSNKWMRAGYGEKLRKFFSEKTNPLVLIDFMGTKIFESSTVDVNILIFEKSKNKGRTRAVIANESSRKDLGDYVQKNYLTINFNTSENWVIISPIEKRIKEKIEKYGTPLKDWDIKINRGILTGLNEAFIISGEKKDELIAKDPKSAEIIRPILRGRDIKKNGYKFADLYIIMAIYGSHKYLKQRYPSIYDHLSNYEEKLKNRGQCKYLSSGKIRSKSDVNYPGYPGMHHWLELDNNPHLEYLEQFSKPKIVFPAIMTKDAFFAYDDEKYVILAPGNVLTGQVNLKNLVKVLTSVGYWALKKFYMGGGIEGELKVNRLQMLPVPLSIKNIKSVDDIYKLYNFNDDEIKYIEDSLSEKGEE